MERVYLDICSLKRPFDDQRQPRVREKAMAVAAIVARAEAGEIALVRSPARTYRRAIATAPTLPSAEPPSRHPPAKGPRQ